MFKSIVAGGIALALITGCGDGDSTGVSLDDLAGTYAATSFEFRAVGDPTTTYDLVQDGGATIELTVEADADYLLVAQVPGFPDDMESGTLDITGDDITFNSTDVSSGPFSLSGSILTITITSGAEFDFDGDATDEPATVHLVFQKT